jgi:hypothetical protein
MIFWTAEMIAAQRPTQPGPGIARRSRQTERVPGQARLGGPQRSRRWLRGISVWAGYRMIGLGCRLARPGLVAGTQTTV